jgi:hypothetical protein
MDRIKSLHIIYLSHLNMNFGRWVYKQTYDHFRFTFRRNPLRCSQQWMNLITEFD